MNARQDSVTNLDGDKFVSADTAFTGPEPVPEHLARSDEENSVNEYRGFDTQAEEEVRELARTYSNAGSIGTKSTSDLLKYLTHMSEVPGVSPYSDVDEALDPNSE
ncbi:hypothetical protein OXX79_011511, partial [Metschnikowia pulcherrima]